MGVRGKSGYEACLEEVHQKVFDSGSPYSAEHATMLRERMYKTSYKVYNLPKEYAKQILKEGLSFYEFGAKETAKIWSYIFKHTDQLEVGLLAIDYYKSFQNKKRTPMSQHWPILKSWAPIIENWAHGDMLAGLYNSIAREDLALVYPEFKKWCQSRSPWKRRMGLLSLLYYYNANKQPNPPTFSQVTQLLTPQLTIDHYYLQKAVGWTIRELIKVYPVKGKKYLKDHLYSISSTAFSTAGEKLSSAEKEPLKLKRQAFRRARS